MWKIWTEIKRCPDVQYEFCHPDYRATQAAKRHNVQTIGRLRLKRDGTHAQKPDFVFRRNGRVHLNRRGRQFSRLLAAEVCGISGSNAGYTMFQGSVKSTGYALHSPVSPSLPLPCVIVRHHISTGAYRISARPVNRFGKAGLLEQIDLSPEVKYDLLRFFARNPAC